MPQIKMLADEVRFVSERTSRFKTGHISVTAAVPMNENAAANALMINLLRRSCKEYPDFTLFNGKLDELYGAAVSASVSKVGESQMLTLSITYLDDRFALTDESIAEQCAQLLVNMLFKPNCKSGSFGADKLATEKRLLIQKIEEEVNDKRTYAFNKCIGYMCSKEAYGRPRCGTVDEIRSVKMADVYSAWKNFISTAVFQITVVGSTDADKVADIFEKSFSSAERNPVRAEEVFIAKGGHFNRYEETFPVNQGKLVIGFRTGMAHSRDNIFAVTVMNDIFGSGTYSKLFMNVREKLSLAYYCLSRIIASKGIMVIEGGIDTDKEKKVSAEILSQLTDLRNGKTDPEVLESSKRSLKERYTFTTPEGICSWYASQLLQQQIFTPEDMISGFETVTMEQVCEAAKKLSIDTIFMLKAQEEEAAENAD